MIRVHDARVSSLAIRPRPALHRLSGHSPLLMTLLLVPAWLLLAAPAAWAAEPWWWDTDWAHRRPITLHNQACETLPAGYTVSCTLDTHGWDMLPSADDVRVVHRPTGEIDRLSTMLPDSLLVLVFSTKVSIPPLGSVVDYAVYYGNPGASSPPADPAGVFLLYDDFDDGSCDGWTLHPDPDGFQCVNGRLEAGNTSPSDPLAHRNLGYILGSIEVSYTAHKGDANRPLSLLLATAVPSGGQWWGVFGYLLGADPGLPWTLSKTIEGNLVPVIEGMVTASDTYRVVLRRTASAEWSFAIDGVEQGDSVEASYVDATVIAFHSMVPNQGAWIDDLTVKPFVSPEPLAAVGPEQSGCEWQLVGVAWPEPREKSSPGRPRLANWPNPFNPETSIQLDVPPGAGLAQVRIYDGRGVLVRTLFEGLLQGGRHVLRWDGRDDAGRAAASAVYFCRATAGSFHESRKVVLVR